MRKKDEIKLSPSEMMKEMFVLNHEQRGKYVTLLMLQATYGIIEEKMYMQIVGQDEMLASLFVVAGNGYVNEMMARQLERAEKYRMSRSNGRSGRKNKSCENNNDENNTNENHMEIICESYEENIPSCGQLHSENQIVAFDKNGNENVNNDLELSKKEKEKESNKEKEKEVINNNNNNNNNINTNTEEEKKKKEIYKERKRKEKEELLKNEVVLEFEKFRKAYPGTKGGLKKEFEGFCRHKDWRECLPLLLPAIERQKAQREANLNAGAWQPEWRHLKTWINQRGWEDEIAPAQPQSRPNYRRTTISDLDWE